jgi:hypothetical protein
MARSIDAPLRPELVTLSITEHLTRKTVNLVAPFHAG